MNLLSAIATLPKAAKFLSLSKINPAASKELVSIPLMQKLIRTDPQHAKKVLNVSSESLINATNSPHASTTKAFTGINHRLKYSDEINNMDWENIGDTDVLSKVSENLLGSSTQHNRTLARNSIKRSKDYIKPKLYKKHREQTKKIGQIRKAQQGAKVTLPVDPKIKKMILKDFKKPADPGNAPKDFLKIISEKKGTFLKGHYRDKIINDPTIPAANKKNFSDLMETRLYGKTKLYENLFVLNKDFKNPKKIKGELPLTYKQRQQNDFIKVVEKHRGAVGRGKIHITDIINDYNKQYGTDILTPREMISQWSAFIHPGRKAHLEAYNVLKKYYEGLSTEDMILLQHHTRGVKQKLGPAKWQEYLNKVEKEPGKLLKILKERYPGFGDKWRVRKQVSDKYRKGITYLRKELGTQLGIDPKKMDVDSYLKNPMGFGAHASHKFYKSMGTRSAADPQTWDIGVGLSNLYKQRLRIDKRVDEAVRSGNPEEYYKAFNDKYVGPYKRYKKKFSLEDDRSTLWKMREIVETEGQQFGRPMNWPALQRWMKKRGLKKALDEDNKEMIDYFTSKEFDTPIVYEGTSYNKGGLINGDLTDTIAPERGPMPEGIPLLDPQESIDRQHFQVGGFASLFGKLSKVPRAVGRFGDIKKPLKIKPPTATEVAAGQAVEDKPAMFLETVRVLEEAPDTRLTPNEWLSYVKGKGVSNTELDEFGLEPLLNNMMKPQKGSASFKRAEDSLQTVQEEGKNITRNFSDLMKTHRGDTTHPEVIAATKALQAHKLKVKQASDVLAKLKSEQRAATPLLSKTELIEAYNREMPKIDMDIAIAEPVSRGANDISNMLLRIRERGRGAQQLENLDIFSNDPRLLTALHQPPQDATGMKIRESIINIMRGTNKTIHRGEDPINDDVVSLLKSSYGGQNFELHKGQHFQELWEGAFPKIFHSTNEIVKRDHLNALRHLVSPDDVVNLAKSRNIPEEEAFGQLYQALNIFDRQIMTADVPIPFWTKKMLYRLGDMGEGRGFFYKSKKNPAHEGAQFIPGGSGYGEIKFYQNFDTGAVRAQEGTYKSGHFSGEVFKGNTGNSPFGWGRFSERIDESGRKILLMEEIQSDLHQGVAQKGYKYAPRLDRHDVLAEVGEFAKQLDTKKQTLESTRLRKEAIKQLPRAERESEANVAELKNIEKAIKKLIGDVKKLQKKVEEQARLTGRSGQVYPDTAFKKSENYAKLFMQGLMKMANDKGYDGIALSTGKMKKAHGSIPKGGDKFYDEIAVKAMQRMAKKSGFRFSNTTIVDGNGYTWEKIPLIEMRDINTGMKIPGESTIPVYKKGGIVNKKMVKK